MSNKRTQRAVGRIKDQRDIELVERLPYDDLITSKSVYDLFRTNARLHGDRPALTMLASCDPEDAAVTYSYTELFESITRAANMFAALGVNTEKPVALLSRTHARLPAVLWGAQAAGVASCINYLLTAEVIAALINAEKAEVLVCPAPHLDAELWQKARNVARLAPCLKTILVIGGAPQDCDGHVLGLEAEMDRQPGDRVVGFTEPGWHDIAALFHTGGTTGVPKLVPQTHLNQMHAAWTLSQLFDLSETDVGLNGFPFFHVGGTSTMGMSILGAAGHVVVLTPSGFRDTEVISNLWRLVERYRATVLGGVPTSIGAMAEVPLHGCDISSLRFALTGGATLPSGVAGRFEKRSGIPLLEQYGMTESVAAIATTPLHGKHLRGSVGIRGPYSSIRIQTLGDQANLTDCAPGEIGLVTVSGPQIVNGYLDPSHNVDAFTPDRALITGDLGYLDDEGYLHLSGRHKDLIIRSGHNIDPISIEEVANAHPNVAVSAAVGMPDEYAGEIPVLYVSAIKRGSLRYGELREFVHAGIHEPPARPRHIFILDEIPVTGVGKIFKPALRTRAVEYKLKTVIENLDAGVVLRSIESSGSGGRCFRVTLAVEAIGADPREWEPSLAGVLASLPLDIDIEWAT